MTLSQPLSRRSLLKLTLASACGLLVPPQLHALSDKEQDTEKRRQASFQLHFGSPYDTEQAHLSPHMHNELKHWIEHYSQGQIYVQIHQLGSKGVGRELAAQVSRGTIQGALLSISNLTPAVPMLDILNIPFWSAQPQAYLNLVTSKVWREKVLQPIKAQGKLQVLYHIIPGPRTITTTKRFNRALCTPQSLKNIIFRVPASQVLKKLYQLCDTTPIDVHWKDVAKLAKLGKIEALDPSIVGLFNGPSDLKKHLGVVCEVESVQDGWAAIISQKFLDSLPLKLQHALFDAAEHTFADHLKSRHTVVNMCRAALRLEGVQFSTLSAEAKQQWMEQCGYQLPVWDDTKLDLLGKKALFEQLLDATKEHNGYLF
ncbi:TRAP transporter substrate-binding protein [Pseudoalteromonas sp. T1lg65]|uniref:TRAP transporter substrate-binding protein n=1 Tax=Pseudoalteromonas sp. T1lg65 TaxID=2077101 RepID=UPI003F797A4A